MNAVINIGFWIGIIILALLGLFIWKGFWVVAGLSLITKVVGIIIQKSRH